jgi:hypothetical protein
VLPALTVALTYVLRALLGEYRLVFCDIASAKSTSINGAFFSTTSTQVKVPSASSTGGCGIAVPAVITSEPSFSGFTKNRHFRFDPTEIKKLRFVNVMMKFNL